MTLIERLQALTGPDREVDAKIATYFGEHPGEGWELITHMPSVHYFDAGCWTNGSILRKPKPYTASLDAAVALAERVLPNERIWVNRINFDGLKQWRASLTGIHVSWGPTPAIALLIATLTAKEAKDE